MRQTGWLCACGLVALSPENVARLVEDNDHARLLAEGLAAMATASREPVFVVDPRRTHSNYVLANVATTLVDAPGMLATMRQRGVLATASGSRLIRFVTSKKVGRRDIDEALIRIAEALREDATD
jgi:threonine aldolase